MVTAEREHKQALYRRPIDVPPFEDGETPDNVKHLRDYVYSVAIPRGDLRNGQVEALEETVRFLEQGGRVAYVEQSSGYGKSRWMEEVGNGYGGRQVYVTPGETASNNIQDKLYGKKDLGRVDKDHKEFGHEVTIVTMQMLEALLRERFRGDKSRTPELLFLLKADLVFADEVHHYLTPERRNILAGFLYANPKSIMLGASATEGYNSIKNAEQQFGKCLHRVDLAEAVEEEVLISPHVLFVKTGVSLDNSRVNSNGTIIFDSSVPVSMRDKMLLEAYLRDCDRERRQIRTISYLSTKEHAYNFAKLAESMGVPANVIVDGVPNRNEIYNRLKEGKLATVATVETAIESLDLPWLEGIIVSAQTKSLRVAYQMFPRPMRNLPGKSEPYIWQAVDNETLYGNRPILVTDILGVRRFTNGSVVAPRKIEGDKWVDFDLGQNRAYKEDTELSAGVEVDVEIIDIHSLFRMGILDRAGLLGKGLLPPREVEKFRAEINDFLVRVYKGKSFPGFTNDITHGLKLYDKVTQSEVSLSNIIARTFGVSTDIHKAVHGNAFKEFLENGKLPQVEDADIEKVGQDENFVDPEFATLCAKFKNGKITDEEKRILAATIREMLEEQRANISQTGVLQTAKINQPMLRVSFFTLGRLLGVNTKSGYQKSFSMETRDKLLEFVNQYTDGEPLGARNDQNQTLIVIPETHPQLGDVRVFLRGVFEKAKSEGFNISRMEEMRGYMISTDEFNGTLLTLLKRLKVSTPNTSNMRKSEFRALLKMAGIEH